MGSALRTWWDKLVNAGPSYGYQVNGARSWLIVNEEHLSKAEEVFINTGIHITCEGRRHLGAALGRRSFVESYLSEKIQTWSAELEALSSIANTQPQAALAALTHGLISRWVYVLRTIEGSAPLLQPLEDIASAFCQP